MCIENQYIVHIYNMFIEVETPFYIFFFFLFSDFHIIAIWDVNKRETKLKKKKQTEMEDKIKKFV